MISVCVLSCSILIFTGQSDLTNYPLIGDNIYECWKQIEEFKQNCVVIHPPIPNWFIDKDNVKWTYKNGQWKK